MRDSMPEYTATNANTAMLGAFFGIYIVNNIDHEALWPDILAPFLGAMTLPAIYRILGWL